jgi:hypothetical protein
MEVVIPLLARLRRFNLMGGRDSLSTEARRGASKVLDTSATAFLFPFPTPQQGLTVVLVQPCRSQPPLWPRRRQQINLKGGRDSLPAEANLKAAVRSFDFQRLCHLLFVLIFGVRELTLATHVAAFDHSAVAIEIKTAGSTSSTDLCPVCLRAMSHGACFRRVLLRVRPFHRWWRFWCRRDLCATSFGRRQAAGPKGCSVLCMGPPAASP